MSLAKGQDTRPEIWVRKFLHANGFRFRKNDPRYLGKPDIVLQKYEKIILIHGCFWHGHNCSKGRLPKTRVAFWRNKVENNKLRDKKIIRKLRAEGWGVIVIWQCEISNIAKRAKRLPRLIKQIQK
jgi:DNA mismatch endonuclease (patch repair protein)